MQDGDYKLLLFIGGLLITFLGFIWGILRFWFVRYLDKHEESINANNKKIDALQKDLNNFKTELPEKYLRRDDWIRFETTVNAKLDGLSNKITEFLSRKG